MKERLISFINSDDNSNFVKKLKLAAEELEELKLAFNDIEKTKDLNQAYGQSLDNYGANLGEQRKGNEDLLYKLLIKLKMTENTSTATLNYIVKSLALALDKDESEIHIEEGWNFFIDKEKPEPASLYLSFSPEVFKDYNITYDRFIQLFNNVVAAGVSTDFFIIEKDSIKISTAMPYAQFLSFPFCNTIRTGQWSDQSTGEIYKSIFQTKYSTQKQKLPFSGGFFSGNDNLDYPSAVVDTTNILSKSSTKKQSLAYCGKLDSITQGLSYCNYLELKSKFKKNLVDYNYASIKNYHQIEGKETKTNLDINNSLNYIFKDYSFSNELRCGEVRV